MGVVEGGAHLHTSRAYIGHTGYGADFSFTIVGGSVCQDERNRGHLTNGGFNSAGGTRHLEELFFRHREVSIHLREVGNHGQGFLCRRPHQCPDAIGNATDNARTCGTNGAKRELIVGIGERSLGLFKLSAQRLKLVFGHFQVILRNNLFLAQCALIVDGELLRVDGSLCHFHGSARLIHRCFVLRRVNYEQNLAGFHEIALIDELANDVSGHFCANFHILHAANRSGVGGTQISSTGFYGFDCELIVVCPHHLLLVA